MEQLRVRGITEVAFGVQASGSAHLECLSWLHQLSSGNISKGPRWVFVRDEVAVWRPDTGHCFSICKGP